ncbi:RILP-like protein 1 isoform X2 [Callorhinchus milii]|uniref:RILP-like protein 1 isoform X2 n=1 Tax=Callorhinchus milii TaxID=7868 RepID=UPI001C3F7C7C|nr:RILP-like protein 1 isoform X2 [Callorhinchus milii]
MEADAGPGPGPELPPGKAAEELTVTDVYELAAGLGQELERLVEAVGGQAVAGLVPRLVRVLELLEALVTRQQSHSQPEAQAQRLRLELELERLRLDRANRAQQDSQHKQELELMEDVWRGEAQDLLTQIAQLQEENKALVDNLSPKSLTITQEEILRQEAGMSERERQVMKKLKEVVDKQRDELRAKDRELTLKNQDVEALQQQLNRLMKINHDLRHKVTVMDAQGRALIEQKAELEALLQTREQETGKLRAEAGKSRDKSPRQPAHNQEEKGKVNKLLFFPSFEDDRREYFLAEALSEEDFLDSEPVVVDVNDTSRPRFTLQELRDVLHERNELKAKVFVLQEELAYYKSEEAEEENAPFSPPSPALQQKPAAQPESSIRRLIFTAIMPMVAAGLIPDDPTLQPIRRLVSLV